MHSQPLLELQIRPLDSLTIDKTKLTSDLGMPNNHCKHLYTLSNQTTQRIFTY